MGGGGGGGGDDDSSATDAEPAAPMLKPEPTPYEQPSDELKEIPDTGFILYEPITKADASAASILTNSAQKQGLSIEYKYASAESADCAVLVNGEVYGSSKAATNKKEAKQEALEAALEFARKIHYTIRVSVGGALAFLIH